MQLLIVHRDAELGEQLVQMVKDYTGHECDFAGSHVAAVDWGKRHGQCGLLVTQLDGDGLDGFGIGAALSEIFPQLQTIFLPQYPASSQKLNLSETKVFPEPIDGEGLINAIDRVANAPGAPDLFHVVDVIQMCCLSGRNGAVQMVKGGRSGIIFLRSGKLVHAETTAERGNKALREIIDWEFVEFAYDRSVRPPVETITGAWDELIINIVGAGKPTGMMERTQKLA